jgi:hypothetical protein
MKEKILFLLFFLVNTFVFAQKYIQIERANIMKVKRIELGESVTFKLKGNDQMWQTKDLTDVIPEQNIALFDGQIVKLQEVAKIRSSRTFLPAIGKQMYRFGGLWLVYASLGDLLDKSEFKKIDIIVPATAFGLGFVFQKGCKYKYSRFGKNHRLRAIDLGFK